MIPCIQFGGDTEVRSEPVPRDPETLDPFGPQNHPITEVKRMDTIALFGGFDGAFEYFDTQQAKPPTLDTDTHKLILPMKDGEPVCGTFTSADGVSIIVERIEGGEVMSGTKFTPGPWKSEWAYGVGNEPLYLTVRQVEGNYRGDAAQVHQAEHIGGITREEMIANANLISTAPELYEALAEFEYFMGGETDAVKKRFSDTRTKARAALAKARGES